MYAELRRESGVSQGMPIAVRHLESIIRMSEAHAAMHLREYVQEQDIDTAIRSAAFFTPSHPSNSTSHPPCALQAAGGVPFSIFVLSFADPTMLGLTGRCCAKNSTSCPCGFTRAS